MAKTWSRMGEQQFHTYPILDELRQTKDYINQFGKPNEPPFFLTIYSMCADPTTRTLEIGTIHRSERFSGTSGDRLY